MPNTFDQASGIRERLAIVAHIGPTMDPHVWGYNPSRDCWYYCGKDASLRGRRYDVEQEGTASLAIIAKTWQMDYRAAMAFIGYPEK